MAKSKKIAAIILAGGYSSRMQAFKPLLPLGNSTVIQMAVSSFRQAGVGDVTVVIGHRAAELTQVLKRSGIKLVFNAEFDSGMYSSVAAGVKSIGCAAEGAFILPADMPLVRGRTIKALVKAFCDNQADVVYPVYLGQRGHPPLIRSTLFPELVAAAGDGGLRRFLRQYEDGARDVDVLDEGILTDLDTQDDYWRVAVEEWRRDIPTPSEADAILASMAVPEALQRHCQLVAQVAERLAVSLNQAGQGQKLDIPLIKAAGLLHDLAKGKPDHAACGAKILKNLGYGKVAAIVGSHTDIIYGDETAPDEAAVVYLADKLVQGDRVISVEERFKASVNRYDSDEKIMDLIASRRANAEKIRNSIEQALGAELAEIISPELWNSAGKAVADE